MPDLEEKKSDKQEEVVDRVVLSAVIAAVMDEKKYFIKRIYLKSKSEKKYSSWKKTGLQESMLKRSLFRKK